MPSCRLVLLRWLAFLVGEWGPSLGLSLLWLILVILVSIMLLFWKRPKGASSFGAGQEILLPRPQVISEGASQLGGLLAVAFGPWLMPYPRVQEDLPPKRVKPLLLRWETPR